MDDWIVNDWDDHPEVHRSVHWTSGKSPPDEIFSATVDGTFWTIRMNDFPEEPLYTLLINGRPVLHFNDWATAPASWGDKPPFPE